jgi:hypothetical protein
LTLPELQLRPLGRPPRSQSLYRLRYPGSLMGGNGLKLVATLLDILADGWNLGYFAGYRILFLFVAHLTTLSVARIRPYIVSERRIISD